MKLKKGKTTAFVVSVIALTIVVFNNIIQLQNIFIENNYNLDLLTSLVVMFIGVSIYSIYNLE